jgi:hypothetical protein
VKTIDRLVTCQDVEPPLSDLAAYEISFLFAETPQQFNLQWLSTHPDLLDYLVAAILKKPRNLVTHVQRICVCYQRNLSEHLYGAMVDLFSVLEGHADDFCGRLLDKVLPKLQTSHAFLLNQYLYDKDLVTLYMVQNSFTVLGKGLLGTGQLVEKVSGHQHFINTLDDPVQLARDHIDNSEFQEAKTVLEQAILQTPAREALHLDILELYKSLQDVTGFTVTQEVLAQQGNPFSEQWAELYTYFKKRNLM